MHLLKTVKYDGIVRTEGEIESRGLNPFQHDLNTVSTCIYM